MYYVQFMQLQSDKIAEAKTKVESLWDFVMHKDNTAPQDIVKAYNKLFDYLYANRETDEDFLYSLHAILNSQKINDTLPTNHPESFEQIETVQAEWLYIPFLYNIRYAGDAQLDDKREALLLGYLPILMSMLSLSRSGRSHKRALQTAGMILTDLSSDHEKIDAFKKEIIESVQRHFWAQGQSANQAFAILNKQNSLDTPLLPMQDFAAELIGHILDLDNPYSFKKKTALRYVPFLMRDFPKIFDDKTKASLVPALFNNKERDENRIAFLRHILPLIYPEKADCNPLYSRLLVDGNNSLSVRLEAFSRLRKGRHQFNDQEIHALRYLAEHCALAQKKFMVAEQLKKSGIIDYKFAQTLLLDSIKKTEKAKKQPKWLVPN